MFFSVPKKSVPYMYITADVSPYRIHSVTVKLIDILEYNYVFLSKVM